MSKLFVVATPIGNLEDITYRAIKILKSVNTILCEDTRITSRLLQKYQINEKKLVIYNDHSTDSDRQKILKIIKSEGEVALVTDAGTPNISDPGQGLVKFLNKNSIKVTPIPGCSSIIAAISSSSLDIDKFTFIGFLPTGKNKMVELLTKIDSEFSFVYLERSSRLISSLKLILSTLGDRNVNIARELTKIHEQIKTDSISNIIDYFNDNIDKLRGEFVIIVEKSTKQDNLDKVQIGLEIKKLLDKNYKTKDISEMIMMKYGQNKKITYDLILQLKK